MQRLNDYTRNKIRNLIMERKTLSQIVNIMKIKKSTVYYWYRKIKGLKYKPIEFNPNLKEQLGEIIGMFSSDGSYHKSKNRLHTIMISFSPHQYNYALRISRMFKEAFGKAGRIYPYNNNKRNVIIFKIYGKAIIDIFREYISWEDGRKSHTVGLRHSLKKYSREFLKGFLKGLVYGDGWITPAKSRVGFGTISPRLAKDFKTILEYFKLKYYDHEYRNKSGTKLFTFNISMLEREKLKNYFGIFV